jgi:hypothetical protein
MEGLVHHLKPRFLTQLRSFRVFPFALFHDKLNTFNPSIAIHDGEIYFSMRHSNMLAAGNMRHYQTFNKTIMLNASYPIDETSFGKLRIPSWGESLDCVQFDMRVMGLEDIRIFRAHGRWFGLGVQLTGNILTGSGNVMHLIAFDEKFGLDADIPLPSPSGAHSEKNWVPFFSADDIQIVYRPTPFDLFLIQVEPCRITPIVTGKAPRVDRSVSSDDIWYGASAIPWSGSSQFVPYDDHTSIGVIHRKFVYADELVYEHAFLKITKSYEIEISKTFHFLSFGIEFCAGLVARDTDIVTSFGSHNDTRAYIATLAREDVEHLFAP